MQSGPLSPILKQKPPAPSQSLEPEELKPTPRLSQGDWDRAQRELNRWHSQSALIKEDPIQQSLEDHGTGQYSLLLLTTQSLPLDIQVLEPD